MSYDSNTSQTAADSYLAAAFLEMLCAATPNIAIAIYVNRVEPRRQQAVIEELVKVGAITQVDGTWVATEKGREINNQLDRAIFSRF